MKLQTHRQAKVQEHNIEKRTVYLHAWQAAPRIITDGHYKRMHAMVLQAARGLARHGVHGGGYLEAGKHRGGAAVLRGIAYPPLDGTLVRGLQAADGSL